MKKLKQLYVQMYELTNPECGKCHIPYSCCSREYCELARERAQEFGVVLSDVNPDIPFLGPTGCIVEPYLRPLCTVHTCDVLDFGHSLNSLKWDRKYWTLMCKINKAEFEYGEFDGIEPISQ